MISKKFWKFLLLFSRLTLAEYHEQEEIFKLRLGHLKKVSMIRNAIFSLHLVWKQVDYLDECNSFIDLQKSLSCYSVISCILMVEVMSFNFQINSSPGRVLFLQGYQ